MTPTPHTVPGDTRHSAVLESCPTDADIKRTIDAAPPAPCTEERPPDPPYSDDILKACEATRQSREANDMRSRRIVRQLWQEREGDTVLAPFLGSGTDLEAGRRTNRNVIGFEIDPQWEQHYHTRSMANTPTLQYHFKRARQQL